MRLIIIIIIFQFPSIYAQEIQKNIFGFATSNTFTYCNVFDTTFTNKVRLMNPQILRFPGGAVGNFYHYNEPAYGMRINEIDSLITGKFPKRARGLISFSKKKDIEKIISMIL